MTVTSPTAEIDDRFSSPGAAARPWSEVEEAIDSAEIFFLSTVRRDGRPHVTPLPAIWLGGALHFCTGAEEQKARNLEGNPQVVLTTGGDRFRSGTDIVVEGRAEQVTDEELLRRLAARWLAKLDWRFEVVDGRFRDPEGPGADSGEPATALVFAVAPSKILVFGKGEPFSQARYRFA